MTKPLSGLRDYNGTYDGAPGTGTIGYNNGTLYRDNEDLGATSGCNGEGCGKHPGVDIPVASGTNVYAVVNGTVVRSECNAGWGGLIVTQSTSPYTGETIYVTYAHLRSRIYSVGQFVNEGVVIGQSGGAAGDSCPGNSTGAHLHFQIDKNDGNNEPWWPANVNQADTAFEVTGKTFNPIVFVTGRYNWTFDQDGFYEYWTTVNIASSSVSSGIFQVDGNLDPYIWRNGTVSCGGFARPCSAQISAEASLYKYVVISLQNYCVSNPAKIYFKTSANDTWDETKSVSFNYTGSATYLIYMGGNSSWTGIIKNLRIDPAVNCNPNASDPEQFSFIRIQN
ncbi:MAG: M23 family metallopeptidase [Patescibacteria group bacterium]